MNADTNRPGAATRRGFLKGSVAAGAALCVPAIVPARALGRDRVAAASERITLGVIGIGPRCTYDLKSMLKEPDVQCVAICDVQASRREAGKKLVDRHYGNRDCVLYRDFRELLAAARHRRRADRHRRPLARAGVDPGGAGRQGRLQREALRPDHRRLPGPGRHHEPHRPRLPGRHPAAQRRQLPGGRASWPTAGSSASSTPCTPRSTCPGIDNAWLPGRADAGPGRGRLGPLAGAGALAAVQQCLRRRQAGAATTTSTPAPGCSTGRRTPSTSASGPTRPTTPCPSSTSRRPPTSRPATPTA